MVVEQRDKFGTSQPLMLGFDPGRQKCGLAVMGGDRRVVYQGIVPVEQVLDTVQKLRQDFPINLLVMGDQTLAKFWQQQLSALPDPLPIVMVDERHSSLMARDRYWQLYPPNWLHRLIPQGMRLPPRPLDDIVAILLIERYLASLMAEAEG